MDCEPVEVHGRRSQSPVGWASLGRFSGLLARVVKTKRPSVLVLSLPRSGSSWVGETLAKAPDAVYLREPVTQSDPTFYTLGTIFDLDRADVRESYRRLAEKAFAAWPDFTGSIVPHPGQWSLRHRRSRRLVIKEVNPLACDWYLRRFRPFVVHLVRHPAAVALSNQKRGFLSPKPEAWERFGELQARASRTAWESLAGTEASVTIPYETLCAEPTSTFRRLFDAVGLKWDQAAERYVGANTDESWRMIDSWRQKVPDKLREAIRRGYSTHPLPWYQDDREWSPRLNSFVPPANRHSGFARTDGHHAASRITSASHP